jgi:hypothetical protein
MVSYHLQTNVMHNLNMENNTNRQITFMFKQCTQHRCSNSTSRWLTFVTISYEPMKNKFHTTIITKSWPMKFVMINLSHPLWMTINFNTYFNQILTHGKTWNFFNIWFYIKFNEEKSTWFDFNYLHDDTWTKENLTHGTWNKFWWK